VERRSTGARILPEDPEVAIGTIRRTVGVVAIVTPLNLALTMTARKVPAPLVAGATTLGNLANKTRSRALAQALLAGRTRA